MLITLECDDVRVADLLRCALQGSHYWARIERNVGASAVAAGDGEWHVEDTEADEGQVYTLNHEALHRGMVAMARNYPRMFGQFLESREDADTGDVYLQCCLFGDVVYG